MVEKRGGGGGCGIAGKDLSAGERYVGSDRLKQWEKEVRKERAKGETVERRTKKKRKRKGWGDERESGRYRKWKGPGKKGGGRKKEREEEKIGRS